MPNVIPKSSTYIVIAAGIAIPVIFALLFGSSFHAVLNRTFFKIGLIVGCIALVSTGIYWLVSLKDDAYEEKSGRMWFYILAVIFTTAWIGGWSAQYKADKSDNIQYDGK